MLTGTLLRCCSLRCVYCYRFCQLGLSSRSIELPVHPSSSILRPVTRSFSFSLFQSLSVIFSLFLSCFLSLALYYPRSLSSFHTLSNFALSSRDQDPKPTFASTAFLQVTDK